MSQDQSNSQATMSAIADAADVSISTVSRVLAGGQGISSKTIDKVRKTAQQLGYRPKSSNVGRPQSKARQKMLKLGLLHTFTGEYVPEHSIQVYLHQKLMIETWRSAHQLGHQLVIDYLDLEHPDQSPLLSPQAGIDGLILKGAVTQKALNLLPANLPTVVLRLPMGMPCPYTSVNCNYHTGISRCVQYLHKLGHQRIAFFCFANQRFDNLDKISSYQQTLMSLGLEDDKYIAMPELKEHPDAESGCQWALEKWLNMDKAPTAIISSEGFCFEFDKLLKKRGLRIPEDISLLDAVTGASRHDSLREHYTRLQMPAQQMSQTAVEHLIRHIRHPQAPPQTVLMEMDFIEGDTTAPPPSD
ncbi:MAG: LacI family DNA-binding transcriptional regulator [Phycisphaeraceae bacterium JB051]